MIRLAMTRLASAFVVLALGAVPAVASQQGVVAVQKWHSMDLCAKQAQAAFPDFALGVGLGGEKLKECLEGKNLPPRALPAPQP